MTSSLLIRQQGQYINIRRLCGSIIPLNSKNSSCSHSIEYRLLILIEKS
jgi:hypothetical protein